MFSLSPGERAGVRASVNTKKLKNSFSLMEIGRSAFISHDEDRRWKSQPCAAPCMLCGIIIIMLDKSIP